MAGVLGLGVETSRIRNARRMLEAAARLQGNCSGPLPDIRNGAILHVTGGSLDLQWPQPCPDEPAALIQCSGVHQIGCRLQPHLPEGRLKTRRLAERDLQGRHPARTAAPHHQPGPSA